MKDRGPASEPRLAVIAEGLVIVALVLLAFLKVIPAETTAGDVLGLPSAFMPNVAVGAIGLLALLGIVQRVWRPEPVTVVAERWSGIPAILVGVLAIIGVLALQYLGPIAAGILVVAIGMPALGERRPRVLAITLAVVALGLVLAYRPWR